MSTRRSRPPQSVTAVTPTARPSAWNWPGPAENVAVAGAMAGELIPDDVRRLIAGRIYSATELELPESG